MFRTLIDSRALFQLLMAIPAIVMLTRYALSGSGIGQLLQSSGAWGERMLIITLAVTPIRMLFKGQRWTMWLFKRRRDLGLAAFAYTALHLAAYVVRQSNIAVILYELTYREYLAGWIAFVSMLALALTSNDWARRKLGTAWKMIQRLVYVTVIAAFLHWFWIRLDHTAAYFHFAPLAVLEAYRVMANFSRPAGHHRLH